MQRWIKIQTHGGFKGKYMGSCRKNIEIQRLIEGGLGLVKQRALNRR